MAVFLLPRQCNSTCDRWIISACALKCHVSLQWSVCVCGGGGGGRGKQGRWVHLFPSNFSLLLIHKLVSCVGKSVVGSHAIWTKGFFKFLSFLRDNCKNQQFFYKNTSSIWSMNSDQRVICLSAKSILFISLFYLSIWTYIFIFIYLFVYFFLFYVH